MVGHGRREGVSIAGRVADRFHLALRCDACGGLTKTKLFVLMNANPACAPCPEAKQAATAKAAGVTILPTVTTLIMLLAGTNFGGNLR